MGAAPQAHGCLRRHSCTIHCRHSISTPHTVGFGDLSHIAGEPPWGGLCPLMVFCKKPEHYDILIPDGHFTQHVSWVDGAVAVLIV